MLCPPLLSAQKAHLYDSSNGLPNSLTNRMFQDREGFIWICTQNGLIRYDGKDFTYIPERGSSINSDVQIFHEDSAGRHWLGTSGGLFYSTDSRGKFISYKLLENDSGLPHVSDIVEGEALQGREDSGYIYVATSGYGIFPITPSSLTVLESLRSKIQEALESQYINRLFLDSVGRLWICYETGGMTVISSRTGRKLESLCLNQTLPNKGEKLYVNDIIEDSSEGKVYLATSNGIYISDPASMTIRQATLGKQEKATFTSLLLYNEGERKFIIVGTENSGLKVFNIEHESLSTELFPNVPYDMGHWKIHCMLKDNQGNVWVGAFQTGLLVIPKSVYGFYSYEFPSCVTSFASDGSTVWIGTDGSGLYKLKEGQKRKAYTSANSGLTNDSIMALTLDGQGRLWIGTYLDGIFLTTPSGEIVHYSHSDELPSSRISVMKYDRVSDNIYIGMFGGGLAIINATSGKILQIVDDERIKWAETFFIRGNNLWIGSVKGLYKYNIPLNEIEENHAPNTVILSGMIKEGKFLLGTRMGIMEYNPETCESRLIGIEEGLADNVVTGLIEGFNGEVWATTTNGLSRIADGKITNYYSYDGLQGNEFRRSAIYRTEKFIYFGGTRGVTIISDTHSFDSETCPHKLRLSGLTIMDRQSDSLLLSELPIKIKNRDRVLSIAYSAMEYTNPQRVRYRYKMNGFDKNWVYDPGRCMASYTNLPTGRYKFCVEAYFEDGNNSVETSVDIVILPPWYLTWWATVIYLLVITVLITFAVLWRMKTASNRLNKMRLDMFTDFTHEIRTPLNLVMGPLKKMRESTENPELKDRYNLMYRNCLRINRIVNQLMDIRKIDAGKLNLNFRQTDIIPFIKDIMQSFEQLAESENIEFTLDSSLQENILWIDQGNFDKMLFNVISNAFKHTPESGKIRISVSQAVKNEGLLPYSIAEYVEISVYNSGSSIETKDIEKVFERFHQNSPEDATKGSGVGLNLAKMLVEKHHGKITADNIDSGVCFSIYLPCGKEHLSRQELNETLHHKDLYVTGGSRDVSDLEKTAMEIHRSTKNKKTVIIVDDDADFLAYLNVELSTQFNVMAYTDASKALAAIEAVRPDAILTDLVMDGMGGNELCRKVRANSDTSLTPVLILTGKTEEDASVQDVVDSGADRILTKPVSIDYLRSSIVQAISIREKIKARGDNSIVYDFAGIKMNTASDRLVSKVMEIISRNIDNPDLSVETICKEAGISRVHLNRRLKELVGTPPSVLIRNVRLRQAAYLLVKNNVNISEVAFRVGYTSLSHFSNSFRECMGISPRDFVSKYQGSEDVSFLQQFDRNLDE